MTEQEVLALLNQNPRIVVQSERLPNRWLYKRDKGVFLFGEDFHIEMEMQYSGLDEEDINEEQNPRGVLKWWRDGTCHVIYYSGGSGYSTVEIDLSARMAERLGKLLEYLGFETEIREFRPEDWRGGKGFEEGARGNATYTPLSDLEIDLREQRLGGMKDNMLTDVEYEQILANHFAFVQPYWESGNFKGYACSDSQQTLQTFLGSMGARTSAEFDDFFTDATKGLHRPRKPLDYGDDPVLQDYSQHAGEFDQHIETSIPDFRANMSRKVNAVMAVLPQGGTFLDIAASEGSLGKTISSLSRGAIQSTSLDPNQAMSQFFREKSTVPGAQYVSEAFGGDYTDETGYKYPQHSNPGAYDVVNETMAFQFMGSDRNSQVAEAKAFLKPGGLFLTEEKFMTDQWDENERIKDEWKSQYYDEGDLARKQKQVKFQRWEKQAMAWDPELHPNVKQAKEQPTTFEEWERYHKTAAKPYGWKEYVEPKARRLKAEGRVKLIRNGINHIVSEVQGDTGTYQVEIDRLDPNSQSITGWSCECDWHDYAFGRTRKFKKFEGRVCSHAMATFWVSQATPLDEGEGLEPVSPMEGVPPVGMTPPAPTVTEPDPMMMQEPIESVIVQPGDEIPGSINIPGTFSRVLRDSLDAFMAKTNA